MTFDPHALPAGATVRDSSTGNAYVIGEHTPAGGAHLVPIIFPTGFTGGLHETRAVRDPGRHRRDGAPDLGVVRRFEPAHRGDDDRTPGDHPEVQALIARRTDHAASVHAGTRDVPTPEAVHRGLSWRPDGRGNVRVPIDLVRALRDDLRRTITVEFHDSLVELDNWPAAREFIVGAREIGS